MSAPEVEKRCPACDGPMVIPHPQGSQMMIRRECEHGCGYVWWIIVREVKHEGERTACADFLLVADSQP